MYIKKTGQCKHAKLSYFLGGGIVHLVSTKERLSTVYMRSSFSLRNSSTLSVFHLRMLSSSAMFPLSSKSFNTGSEPRTYLICRPLNSLGLSLLTKAWTWGNLPSFHPQTSRMAPAYSCKMKTRTVIHWKRAMELDDRAQGRDHVSGMCFSGFHLRQDCEEAPQCKLGVEQLYRTPYHNNAKAQ